MVILSVFRQTWYVSDNILIVNDMVLFVNLQLSLDCPTYAIERTPSANVCCYFVWLPHHLLRTMAY